MLEHTNKKRRPERVAVFFVITMSPHIAERVLQEAVKREASQEITITPDDLRFSYDRSPSNKYSSTPIRMFDDGKKTFIQMPKEMRVSEAPALFLIEDDSEPIVTNYRVKGDYYILACIPHRN